MWRFTFHHPRAEEMRYQRLVRLTQGDRGFPLHLVLAAMRFHRFLMSSMRSYSRDRRISGLTHSLMIIAQPDIEGGDHKNREGG